MIAEIKKILCFVGILCMPISGLAQSFVNPNLYQPSKENQQKVLDYIKKQLAEDYAAIGQSQNNSLLLMEKENYQAFQALIQVNNKKLLDKVIKTYCGIGMCNYTTILKMYQEQEKLRAKGEHW